MLSIVIPTYNFDVFPLVKEVNEQATRRDIEFEIIVLDDCSTTPKSTNECINSLANSSYEVLPKNVGRSAIRNLLTTKASFDWLLFLDADVFPKEKNFISSYMDALPVKPGIVYGGILYQESKPEKHEILRWKYGMKRESLNVNDRNKDKYLRFLTLNFLIHKDVFDKVSFNEDIPNMRHEDTLFALELKKQKINLSHINNPVYHLGLESNEVFLDKSMQSVKALHFFMEQGLINANDTLLTRFFVHVTQLRIHGLLAYVYRKFKTTFEKHLISANPNLMIFDFYRLCYICNLEKN